MAVIDIDRLLTPVSDDEPSGPDLEYDPAFQAMLTASKGKPEQEFGDNVIPAVDPEWRTVREHAVELLGRTRDIRPLISLAAASTMVDGIQSLGTVLDGLRRLLDQQWETVHPELDREDDNDPTMRFNALLGLCDPEGLPRCVRDATLVELRGIGSFSYRSIQIANGQAQHTGEGDPPSTAMVEGAFLDCDLDELTARATSVDLALSSLITLESDLQQRVGASATPDLSPVRTVLSEVHAVLTEQLNRRGVGAAAPTAAVDSDPAAPAASAAPTGAVAPAPPPPGEVHSREDVVRALDKICDFYQKNEPSSPIPLLLKRAKRLVDKSFVEILRDIAPGGMSEVETVSGIESE